MTNAMPYGPSALPPEGWRTGHNLPARPTSHYADLATELCDATKLANQIIDAAACLLWLKLVYAPDAEVARHVENLYDIAEQLAGHRTAELYAPYGGEPIEEELHL